MLLPAAREARYYGVFLPPNKEDALEAIKQLLKTDELIEATPVRGDPDIIRNIRLYMAADAKLKSVTAVVNMRAEMILTEFSPTGSVISLQVTRSKTAGDVVAVKYNDTFDKLERFNTDDFEGMMCEASRNYGHDYLTPAHRFNGRYLGIDGHCSE